MLKSLAVTLLGLLTLQAPAQENGTNTELPSVQHGLPGVTEGTERWLVTFKTRSFDLSAFKKAVYSGASAEEVAGIVADLKEEVTKDQAGFSSFVADLGGKVFEKFWIFNGCALEIPFSKLETLRAHPRVLLLHPDEVWLANAPIKTATNTSNHVVDPLQTKGLLGQGVAVAIMDTGLDSNMAGLGRPHRTFYVKGDINNKTGGGLNGSRILANIAVGTYPADDPHGHGTGCAGISAGEIWGTGGSDKGHAPMASIVGYGISTSAKGSSNSTVMAMAWQQIAAGKVKYGIVAANNSFSGSPTPTSPVQQALDSCALNADVLCVVAAGNNGASTTGSQSAANGLAVAAVSANTKRVASFSSRGPLSGDTQRFYPDISACGVNTRMPKLDNENTDYVGSGTSMAAPQVAGAATLFRSILKTATALETKAVLLATTENITKQNLSSPYNSRNAYGVGFLRDDRAIDIAQGKGLLTTSTITAAGPKLIPMTVTKGKAYAVALTWYRHTLSSKNWSNLALKAVIGMTTLASSDTPRNLYEKIVFIAPVTGKINLEVSSTYLERNPLTFSIAAFEVPAPFMPGHVASFGKGCPGSGKISGVQTVIPAGYQTKWGETRTSIVLGYYPHRCQQIFSASAVPSTFTATGVAFRHDNASNRSYNNYWVSWKMDLGLTTGSSVNMSTIFANNISGTMTNVVNSPKINLPYWTSVNTSASNWLIKIPFSKPYTYTAQAGRNLLMDTTKSAAPTSSYVYYYIDATTASTVSRVYSTSATATTGKRTLYLGSVVGFTNSTTSGAIPVLTAQNTPEIGSNFKMEIKQGATSTATLLMAGYSKSVWQKIPLPLDLNPFGGTSCFLLVSPDLSYTGTTNATGDGLFSVGVPLDKSIIQMNIYVQAAILDKAANGLQTAFTNALEVRIGGQP